jgi:hypothetical protein
VPAQQYRASSFGGVRYFFALPSLFFTMRSAASIVYMLFAGRRVFIINL